MTILARGGRKGRTYNGFETFAMLGSRPCRVANVFKREKAVTLRARSRLEVYIDTNIVMHWIV